MPETAVQKLFGEFSADSLRSGALDIAQYVIIGLLCVAVAYFVWIKYQDKKIFIYPTRIFRQRRNGIVKEFNTFGGYIKTNGLLKFVIKMTKFKKKEADKLPLSEYMDEDNRVYYWQVSPDSPLIQTKREFVVDQILVPDENFIEPSAEERGKLIKEKIKDLRDTEQYKETPEEELKEIASYIVNEEIEEQRNKTIDITKPVYTPIPTDLKQQAMAEINNYKNILGVDVNKQMAYFVMGVIALAIIAVVLFYIAMNKGDIPILTEYAPLFFFRRKKNNK